MHCKSLTRGTQAFVLLALAAALKNHVGMLQPNMHFTRVAYDPGIATDFRQGQFTNNSGPDLAAIEEALIDENRVYYRFFTPDSCDIKCGQFRSPAGAGFGPFPQIHGMMVRGQFTSAT